MEVIEYMNSEEGHGTDPSQGIEHQDSFELTAGDVILVQSGDFVKVVNESEHDQLTYLRVLIEKVGELSLVRLLDSSDNFETASSIA